MVAIDRDIAAGDKFLFDKRNLCPRIILNISLKIFFQAGAVVQISDLNIVKNLFEQNHSLGICSHSMHSFARSFLLTLALLAVACAQVFGTQRGYMCDHGAIVTETVAEHCHSEVSENTTKSIPCEDTDGLLCDSKGDKKIHQPLQVDLQVTPATLVALTVPAFVAVLVNDFSIFNWTLDLVLIEDERGNGLSFENERLALPSAAVQVARCMVILI